MAQTGYTPILIYSSTTASAAPGAAALTNSTLGSELAINITDGKLFYKDNAGSVQVIGWKITPTTAGGTGLTSYSAGDLLYYATGTTLAKLAIGASTTILTSSGTAPQWSAASGVTVGKATNLVGGVAGSVPYQTAADTTAMLAIGASGRYLVSSGTAPQWNAPAALTKTDDTNVTLTLGGSASTALLNAASLTLGWTGQLAVSRGGTGIGSYTVGDILYASGTTTLAKLADVATGNALISGGVGIAPSWGKVGLTTHVSGTLPIANGGTNLTSFTANGVLYASSTSALATSNTFTWDGTTYALTGNGSGIKAMTGSDSTNYYAGFLANYSYGEVLRFYVKGGSVAESTILSWGEGAGLTINNGGASAPVIIKTANIDRVSIKSNGDMKWSDNGASGENAMIWERLSGVGATNSGRLKLAYNSVNWTPASTPDTVRWDGNTGGLTILTSAKKYKRNITPVTDEQLDKALLLEPSYYQRLDYDYWEYGFIADQADEIGLGELVSRVNGEINGFDYEKIGVFAIGLIKKQQRVIANLESRIIDLEKK